MKSPPKNHFAQARARRKVRGEFRLARAEAKPRRTARILGGQNPKKKKCPFHFRKNPLPRKSKKQGTLFLFGVAE
ncbi:MAG: hypothetical protein A2W52_02690 [Candidatus Taylorbacteria bacterium RIFCSPHIGHO2_02_49_25]|uniref:Uncharacterized protein n=2 Tax=Parcubacteria group TaxID=1794811 RepID=A0A1F6YL68_9BACT|nr:MAG: hypothetical protein A2225_02460 [Candidatus Nomurabacteria bacterium RIFOXYA2_FULL_42_12]OHA19954.1 MAG: hypothetical protein A2759_01275 [Candidatus Taylorbacteria bacterium RIFCSPHIGHO2_01_FULL_49_60]OHA22270.1 MAG: hypothetical protein A2W52_02690 [Candidatus Taylorbacteria bacterium RIFCSPHIGHO2_02_49_25]OHA35638.1 MAG: hypothetical protein A3B27_00120 [Candidatus Taylorbacteria bacterium RIFCSPLOWO2_01_FULL_50_130]